MKFDTTKKRLTTALTRAAYAVPKKTYQPILAGVRMTADRATNAVALTGTDLDLTVNTQFYAEVSEFGGCVVDVKHMLASLKTTPDGNVSVELTGTVVIVRGGGHQFASPVAGDEQDYPQMKEAHHPAIELTAHEMRCILDKVNYCAASYDVSSILGGTLFDFTLGSKAQFCATDGSRLACYTPDVTDRVGRTIKAIVPAGALEKLAKLIGSKNDQNVAVYVDTTGDGYAREVTFTHANGHLTTRTIGGEYPRYSELFPAQQPGYREYPRTELINACKAACVTDNRINMLVLAGTAAGSKDGTYRASFSSAKSSESRVIALNGNYLREFCESTGAGVIRLECDDKKPNCRPVMLIDAACPELKHLLMPITLDKKDPRTGNMVIATGWWSALDTATETTLETAKAVEAPKPVKAVKVAKPKVSACRANPAPAREQPASPPVVTDAKGGCLHQSRDCGRKMGCYLRPENK